MGAIGRKRTGIEDPAGSGGVREVATAREGPASAVGAALPQRGGLADPVAEEVELGASGDAPSYRMIRR